MNRLQFKCTLHSDVVLSASPATEGFHRSLDYIPGSKFLGIVAGRYYDINDQQRTLDLFHNGTVRFGDAHPFLSIDNPSYRTPACWFTVKGKSLETGVYLHHNLSPESKEKLTSKGIQLRQVRGMYFTEGGDYMVVEQNFSIKSAYDSKEKRSEDEQMFGYFALKKGSVWTFAVDIDDNEYIDIVTSALVGKRRIGRSSSAEYGLIQIEGMEPFPIPPASNISPGEAFIYAKSNWCFYDAYGRPTLQPMPEHLGLPTGSEIHWEKSHVLSRVYRTWNKHRSNRDADRVIIEKGSVIAVKLSDSINTGDYIAGIGAHRSEGFGQVWWNPSFTHTDNEQLPLTFNEYSPISESEYFAVQKGEEDDDLINFLSRKIAASKTEREIDAGVNEFIKKYGEQFAGVTSSQWGQIRAIANRAENQEQLKEGLFDEERGFFFHGQLEPVWRVKDRRGTFKDYLFEESGAKGDAIRRLAVKLASEMAKFSQS